MLSANMTVMVTGARGCAGALIALLVYGAALSQSIYTCVDGKGRKITSDRPIAECTDRPQQELSATGTVRRVLGPTLTAQERALEEERDKLAAETRALAAEDKRRERALLLRYPSLQVHDRERALALAQVDEAVKASARRSVYLLEQRQQIYAELEFYKKDPSKVPGPLRRRLEENDNSSALQKRFVAEQDLEKRRVNTRFDEELGRLQRLWALTSATPGPTSAASATTAPASRK